MSPGPASGPASGPSRRGQVPPFAVMTVLHRVAELRAAGRDVVSLCAGEPSSGAPTDVRARMAELMAGRVPLGYSETPGLRPLRVALAEHYGRWYDLDVSPDRVAVTTGSSGAFTVAFLAAFDAGDRVALTRPGYPAYRNTLAALGCTVVELACGPERDYRLGVDQLAAAHAEAPLAGLVLASPANPTGTMVDADGLAAIAGWCRDAGVRLVSDEIYHGIVPAGADPGRCAWSVDPSALVVSSFSKFWGMTGWRLGWCLVPPDLWTAFESLAGNLALCAPVPAQHAAVAAFTERSYAEATEAVRSYDAARAVVLDALPGLGCGAVAPADGAFYVYAELGEALGPYPDAVAWCTALLESEGVALVPGADFDGVDGGRAVRISLAAGPEAVGEAVRRIERFSRSRRSHRSGPGDARGLTNGVAPTGRDVGRAPGRP